MSPRARVYSALAAALLLVPAMAQALTVAVPVLAPKNPDGTVAGGSSGVTVTCSATLSSMLGESFASGVAEVTSGGTFVGGATSVALAGVSPASFAIATATSGTLGVKCTYTAVSSTGSTATKSSVASAGITPPPVSAPVVTSFSGPPSPTIVGTSSPVSVSVDDPAATFAWTATGGTFAAPTAASTEWTAPAGPGTYTLTVTATNAGGSVAASAVVTTALSLYQGALATPLRYPRRVAATTEGDLLVVDDLGSLVLMTRRGDLLGSVPNLGATAVAMGGGTAFVATKRNGILRIDPGTGRVVGKVPWRLSSTISGMAYDAARGVLWASLVESQRAVALRLDGTQVREITTGEGRALLSLADVALDVASDTLWLAERDGLTGNRLHAYAAADGTWLRSMVTAGLGLGKATEIGAITLDPAARVFVSDTYGGTIQVMTSAGVAVGTIGTKGDTDGYLLQPRGIAFMANGDLAIANSWFNRVDRFGTGAALPTCAGDADCDGLPDAWEDANFGPGAKHDAANALLDADGDGLLNREEHALGTNPFAADSDGDGVSDRDEVVAGTNPLDPADQGPAVAAGDLGQVPPGIVRLNATSQNAAGCTASWRQTSGPKVTLRDADTFTPSFLARAAGAYAFETVAICAGAKSAPAASRVEVLNVAPLADAGRPVVTAPGHTVTISAAFSSDANDDALTYSWSQRVGPATAVTARGATLTVLPTRAGYYEYALTARDRAGATSTRAVGVAVVDPTLPSALVANPLQTVAAGGAVTLDASPSLPSDASFAWNQVEPEGGVVASGATATVTIPAPGRYVFEVTAMKGGVASPPARAVVLAGQGGLPPTASAVAADTAAVGSEIALDGSGSAGASGLTWAWRQLSGPAAGLSHADAPVATAVPFAPGVYVFELTVADAAGAVSAPATVRVDVVAAGKPLPVAAVVAPASAAVGELVVLNARGSTSASRYRWSQVSGPWVALDCASATPTFVAPAAGSYAFELVVDDGKVRSAPVIVTVDVQ